MMEDRPLRVGPLFGYYFEARSTVSAEGHRASAFVYATADCSGSPLAQLEVGPFSDPKTAELMLFSTARWQIENRAWAGVPEGKASHLMNITKSK